MRYQCHSSSPLLIDNLISWPRVISAFNELPSLQVLMTGRSLPGHRQKRQLHIESRFGRSFHKSNVILPRQSIPILSSHLSFISAIRLVTCELQDKKTCVTFITTPHTSHRLDVIRFNHQMATASTPSSLVLYATINYYYLPSNMMTTSSWAYSRISLNQALVLSNVTLLVTS